MKRTTPLLGLLPLLLAGVLIASCGGGSGNSSEVAYGLKSETVTAADHASAMAFAPDGRLFFAEHFSGDIRIVDAKGAPVAEPFAHIDVATWLGLDWGLTGLALDPDFATNHYVYVFFTEPVNNDPVHPIGHPVLARFTERDNKGADRTAIINDLPQTRMDHQGFKANGRIHFGPDRALYLSVGDYDWGTGGPNGTGAALDPTQPAGKILRVNTSGQPLPDNPFVSQPPADPRVFARGFAVPTDFAFSPEGKMYGTDATDSCEELDVIQAGGNYGWPDVGPFPFSDCYFGDQVKAIHLFTRPDKTPGQFQSFVRVSGLEFVTAARYTALGDALLTCEAETSEMRRVVVSGNQVTSDDKVLGDCDGDITTSGDGTIYYSNATEIRRLLPGQTGG